MHDAGSEAAPGHFFSGLKAFELFGKSAHNRCDAPVTSLVENNFFDGEVGRCLLRCLSPHSFLLLLPDQQSNSASLETLLALLQAEGAKIEEDTEVRLASLGGMPRIHLGYISGALGHSSQSAGPFPPGSGAPYLQSGSGIYQACSLCASGRPGL
jgi:hypothetical protein